MRSERQAELGRLGAALAPGGMELQLVKPLTFMNLSGKAVQAALTRSRASPAVPMMAGRALGS